MFKDVYLIMSEFFGDRFGPDVVCSGKQAGRPGFFRAPPRCEGQTD
jgi:hypothetical protein